MLIGYCRTSTTDQEAGLEAQERDLTAFGCERVFSEQVSSVAGHRQALAEALGFAREGDVICTTKPDRLARSTADLLKIVDDLTARKIGLVILSMGGATLDTRQPTSRLMLTMLAAIAEFERAIMLERQKDGIAKAKSEGKYQGRKATARAKGDQIVALAKAGHTRVEIAQKLKIGVASVYRVLRENQKK